MVIGDKYCIVLERHVICKCPALPLPSTNHCRGSVLSTAFAQPIGLGHSAVTKPHVAPAIEKDRALANKMSLTICCNYQKCTFILSRWHHNRFCCRVSLLRSKIQQGKCMACNIIQKCCILKTGWPPFGISCSGFVSWSKTGRWAVFLMSNCTWSSQRWMGFHTMVWGFSGKYSLSCSDSSPLQFWRIKYNTKPCIAKLF